MKEHCKFSEINRYRRVFVALPRAAPSLPFQASLAGDRFPIGFWRDDPRRMISEGFFLGAQTFRWPAHDGEVGIIFRYAIQNFLAIADFVIEAVKIVIPAKAGIHGDVANS